MGLENIRHVVVVMFENRSFDNLLGSLYGPANPPAHFIPAEGAKPFDGLRPDTYFNPPATPGAPPVAATLRTSNWNGVPASQVPTPDPHEEFDFVTDQLYGCTRPPDGSAPDMSGFLRSYATVQGVSVESADQIMQNHAPGQAAVLNGIAAQFAVCDAWFASVPTQTWPNRGFVHSGSSDGYINNENYIPYDIDTIFNVLERQNQSWGVFHDTTLIPALTYVQFLPKLALHADKVQHYHHFTRLCAAPADAPAARKLPSYAFIEPRFVPEPGLFKIDYPSDYHPPHNVCRGEQFLAGVYEAVRNSPYRDEILLLITFDEHGGCYDHVPPPAGATPPQPGAQARATNPDGTPRFNFERYGVRVPAIVVSSYVEAGTVFRAPPGSPPYDHCSILATLRDWLAIPDARFLPSPRIAHAPSLDAVLTRSKGAERGWPVIQASCSVTSDDTSPDTALNGVQHSLLAAAKSLHTGMAPMAAVTEMHRIKTYRDALAYMRGDAGRR